MSGRACWLVAAAWALSAGCALAPPSGLPAVDGAEAVWGDEYEGILADTDLTDAEFHAARPSLAADALCAGGAPVVRAGAAAGAFGARYRESAAGRAGAVEFSTARIGLVAGAVRASLGEGAVLADARDASSVEPRASRTLEGLRVAPSSSTWGSSLGAGARVSFAGAQVAAAAWRDRERPHDARAFVSLRVAWRNSAAFAAAGQSRAGARVFSLGAAHVAGAAFVTGEAGLAPDGARLLARMVAGGDGGWRALVAAGAPAAAADPAPAARASRWGGAVERRARVGSASTRTMLSTRTRRDGAGGERRQRAECYASLGGGGMRAEAGVRATRECVWTAADLLEGARAFAARDELRARVALRSGEAIGDALRVEQSYRVEFVVDGVGPAGRVMAWSGRARWRAVDARAQASAFDLAPGQLAYTGRAVLPGAATFTTLSRSGIDLSASVRLSLGPWAVAGVQGVWPATGEARYVLHAGVRL